MAVHQTTEGRYEIEIEKVIHERELLFISFYVVRKWSVEDGCFVDMKKRMQTAIMVERR